MLAKMRASKYRYTSIDRGKKEEAQKMRFHDNGYYYSGNDDEMKWKTTAWKH